MTWSEWLENDANEALAKWKQAARNISQRFHLAAGYKVQKASAKQNERAFWLLIHKPLDGIRLIAVRLLSQGNTNGQIELRIWTYAERKEIWPRFERGPTFIFRDIAFIPYPCTPQGSWKAELAREGTEVRGKAFSGKLSDLGEPGDAVALLRSLFESFSDFVLERNQMELCEQGANCDLSPLGNGSGASRYAAPLISADTRRFEPEEEIELAEFEKGLSSLSISEREAIIKVRVGQTPFRVNLLNRWNSACSVTGLDSPEVLIASHIKRWSDCESAAERWDVNNGLLLTPSLDKAFDLGFISFEHDGVHRGRLIVSSEASGTLREELRLDNPQLRIREWYQGLGPYLLHHRQRWGL